MDDTAVPTLDDSAPLLRRHRIDVDDYHRMAEAGILRPDERVELIDGEIIDMPPIGQDHAAIVNRLNRELVITFGEAAIVSVQNSVRLDRLSEPQPDFAILRARADFNATGERAGPADVLLLIEVSDSTLRFDRALKLPLYARAGVPEVWIVDVRQRQVVAYRRPGADGYAETVTFGAGDVVSPTLAPEVRIAVGPGVFG